MLRGEQVNKPSPPSMPIEEILVNVTRGLVQAQHAMDSQSVSSEIRIKQNELDKKYGLSAKWYTVPELSLDLRLAFEISGTGNLTTHLVDARYKSQYEFDAKGSSLLQTKIVAVPPSETLIISLLSEEEVAAKVGRLKKMVEVYNRSDTPSFIIRYHPFTQYGYAGGLWFVLLTDTTVDGQTTVRAVAVVDDTTGEVIRLWMDDGGQ